MDSEKGTIIYIGGFELPDKNAAAHRVIANGKILRDLGYNVVYIGLTTSVLTDEPCVLQFDSGFVDFSLKKPVGLKNLIKYFFYISEYKKIIDQFNDTKAVICYNMPSLIIYKLYQYCRKKDIQVVSDMTEWYRGSLKDNFLIVLFKRFDSYLRMNIINKKIDGVIAISQYINEFYKDYLKTVKIPPLVDCDDEKWSNNFEHKSKIIELVYAGGAFSIKNSYVKDRLDLVISALSFLKKENYKFRFKVVGCDLSEFNNFYPHLLTDVNYLDSWIEFYGKVSHQKAINLIKSSDFSIFIRDKSIVTKAGFPTKFVESITCGVPVLTNNNSNVEDYLMDGKTGFLLKTDSMDSLIESLRKPLSLNPEEVKKIKYETYMSKLFDYRKYLEQMRSFLSN